MKKSKILDKLKKTLIVTMCSITLFFAMPIKTNASAIDNVMYIFRVIPDGLMVLINKFVGDDPVEETSKMISVDDAIDIKFDASVYNFNVLPDRIFSSGTIDSNGETILPLLDTNFFRNTNDNENSADILRPVISNVYYNLRNLVIILMLVVLLYVGVRIIISSASNNKAKYKKMLQAWGGGMCLIFCMQYIMSFCMFLNQKIISILAMKNQESQYYYIATEQKLDVETMSLSATGTAAENVEKVIDFSNALNNAEAMIGKEGLWGTVVTVVPEGVDTATDILMEGASNIASGISDVADDVADTTKDWWFVGDAASNVASDVSKATSDLAKWIDKTHYNEETEDIMEGSARCLELTQDRRFIAEHFLEINQEDENLKIFEFNFFEYSKLTSDGKLKNDTSSEWKIASQYIFIDSEGNLYVLYKKETNIKPSAIICDNSKIGLGTGIWAYLQVISGNYLGAAFATQDLIPTEDSPFNSCNSIYKGNVLEYFRTVASTDTEEILFVNHKNKEVTEGSFLLSIGYSVLYIILALEVVVFVYQYIKRVIKLAFLTMISPVIALLYPIDAVGDGSAQTFNTWFKEYFFNSLIQPLHMILYTIFISSAMQLLANNNGELNVVYAIVIYAYMIPAETFMKKLFGFNKAATTGLDNAAAGMLTLKGMDLLKSLSSNNSRSNAGNQNSQRARVRQREIPAGIGIMGGPGPTGGGPAPTGRGPTPPRGGPEPTGRGPTPTGVGPAPTRVGPDPTGRGP
ncbi:MAG: hypothetical protein J6A89_03495, partial [Clostridia bacterium]|nr:hypothetical protein [Clostridia bacterium]